MNGRRSFAGAMLVVVATVGQAVGAGSVALELVTDGLTAPNYLTMPDDGSGRRFVVDQIGRVRIIDAGGSLLSTPFLDVSSRMVDLGAFGPGSFDERGLLGLAFHPGFAGNGQFYVYYSARRNPDTTISFEPTNVPNGDTDFFLEGIHFTGGVVGTQFQPPLYCSGLKSYEVFANGIGTITFPEPVAGARFFFVHKVGTQPGGVTAVLSDDSVLGPFPSNPATFGCDAENFLTLSEGFPVVGIKQLVLHAGTGTGLTLFLDDLEVSRYNHTSRVSEFTVSASDPNRADLVSERIVLEIDQPEFNHNAGMLAFGPDDGFLYISVGDGGNGNDVGLGHNPTIGNGQDLSVLLGKILRIDVDGVPPYGIPLDNPFVDLEGRDEIWAYGLRNPFRFSFDMGGSHELFSADVGQELFEEVNIVEGGRNLGWNTHEGFHCFDPASPFDPPDTCPATGPQGEPLVPPIIEYPHTAEVDEPQGIAVQGGFVYRGTMFAGLAGGYLFGDWSRGPFGAPADGSVFIAAKTKTGDWRMTEPRISNESGGRLQRFVLGFGQDQQGEVYVCSTREFAPVGTTGAIFKIVPSSGDLDTDADIDGNDLFKITDCWTGPETDSVAPGCELADVDADRDIDLADFSVLQLGFTAPR